MDHINDYFAISKFVNCNHLILLFWKDKADMKVVPKMSELTCLLFLFCLGLNSDNEYI